MKFALVFVALIAVVSRQAYVLAEEGDEVVGAQSFIRYNWGHRVTCAVLVTLKNDQQLALRKVPKSNYGVLQISSSASIKGWVPMEKVQKKIANSTFVDYIRAAGTRYHFIRDNMSAACKRMMALN